LLEIEEKTAQERVSMDIDTVLVAALLGVTVACCCWMERQQPGRRGDHQE
jgi:hypothetical protein